MHSTWTLLASVFGLGGTYALFDLLAEDDVHSGAVVGGVAGLLLGAVLVRWQRSSQPPVVSDSAA